MLAKLARKHFSTPILSWGLNTKNLGYIEETNTRTTIPYKIALASDSKIIKAINGYSDSLVLTDMGQVFHSGTHHVFQENTTLSPMVSSPIIEHIIDIDCDITQLVFLNKNGQVFETHRENKSISEVRLPMPAKFIASGYEASIAILEDEQGLSHVFAWGFLNPKHAAIFNNHQHIDTENPVELLPVSALINSKQSKVKKVRMVKNSAVILLENGDLITWGDNTTGNLGVPRSELSRIHSNIDLPAEPLHLNHIHAKVTDFDLSLNVLILLTEKGEAYYSGFDNVLKLRRISFFEEQIIQGVGCNFNHFFVQAIDGKWYSNKPFEGLEKVKFFGDFDLYQLEPSTLQKIPVSAISGKYQNAFAF